MAASWQVVTGGDVPEMQKNNTPLQDDSAAALTQIKQILHEFQIENVSLFDHDPVLRIQVSDAQFARALQVRETLIERIKPLGYRFVAIDLDEA